MKTAEQVFVTNRAGLHVPAEQAVRDLFIVTADQAVSPSLENSIREVALDDGRIEATAEQIYKFLRFPESGQEDKSRISEEGVISVDPQMLSSFALKNVIINRRSLADTRDFSRSSSSRNLHRTPLLGKLTRRRLVSGRFVGAQWSTAYKEKLAERSLISLAEDRKGE